LSAAHGKCIEHVSCPDCGSKDNVGIYEDGYEKCFGMGCGYYKMPGQEVDTNYPLRPQFSISNAGDAPKSTGLLLGEYEGLAKRCIPVSTCRKYGYMKVKHKGDVAYAATYYDKYGKPVAQKIRMRGKKFSWVGNPSEAGLFGSQVWGRGKKIVVTEGEIDALSVSTCQGDQWPVVSVPNGAGGAAKSIRENLEYLEGFDEVVLMFDNDAPGRNAAIECAELFAPGKCKIAKLSRKDPNEHLIAGEPKAIISAMWGAKEYRPDGIVPGKELYDSVMKEDEQSPYVYPFSGLNEKLHGIRSSEIVCITAGSGIGKSALVREIAYSLIHQDISIGMVCLEESVRRTGLALMGLAMNKPVHIPSVRKDCHEGELQEAFKETLGTGSVYLYDHWGSIDIDNLIGKLRYMVRGCGCQAIILDHISIMVSGVEEGDERRLIDNTMTKLRSLAQELDIILIIVSHLKRPAGNRGHEEGAFTSLAQLRGSASLGQLSDCVIGLERDQQSEDTANEVTVRILKNRFSGETGVACTLVYSQETGRLTDKTGEDEVEVPF